MGNIICFFLPKILFEKVFDEEKSEHLLCGLPSTPSPSFYNCILVFLWGTTPSLSFTPNLPFMRSCLLRPFSKNATSSSTHIHTHTDTIPPIDSQPNMISSAEVHTHQLLGLSLSDHSTIKNIPCIPVTKIPETWP